VGKGGIRRGKGCEGERGAEEEEVEAEDRERERRKRQPNFLEIKKGNPIQLTSVAETTSLPPRNLLAERVTPEVKPTGEGLLRFSG